MQRFETNSEIETRDLGVKFASEWLPDLRDNCIAISLSGDFGTGKTNLVKGIARGLGIEEAMVTSPSYSYVKEHEYQVDDSHGKLVHMDAWRIESPEDFKLLGVEEYLKPGNLVVIEWPKEVINIPDKDIIRQVISLNIVDEHKRVIERTELN